MVHTFMLIKHSTRFTLIVERVIKHNQLLTLSAGGVYHLKSKYLKRLASLAVAIPLVILEYRLLIFFRCLLLLRTQNSSHQSRF